jgi:membrane-associated phospholipid phosphatase
LGRIYVGIHYPIDVAGGMLIGSVSALLAINLVPETSRVPSWLLKQAKRFCVA